MIVKSIIFEFLLVLLPFINAKEKEIEKTKNVILSMFLLNSGDYISPFSLKYRNFILTFKNFTIFDVVTKNSNIIQDAKDKTKCIFNNITLIFKSEIDINNGLLSTIEFIFEINYDKFIFENNGTFISLVEFTPNKLYILENTKIGKLSYFNEFNKLQKATFFDENGKKFENMDITSVFIDISKKLIYKKISHMEYSFNILTYDLDKILNNMIGNNYECSKYVKDATRIFNVIINNIEISINSMFIEENTLYINDMKIIGIFTYYNMGDYRFIDFSIYNDMDNNAYFDKNNFELNIFENNIIYEGHYPTREKVHNALKMCFEDFIKIEIKNYYAK